MDRDNQTTLEERMIKSLLAEHRSTRRWKNARFIIWLVVAVLFLILISRPMLDDNTAPPSQEPYASLVKMTGMIMPGADFSASKMIPQLQKAFSDEHAKGVVLLINSPGGSPVQSAIIHDKIEQLKHKYHKTVIVVAEDTLASGAYLVATAADKIYVNADTLTGSIGVIMSGFGFTDTIEKLGITRRVFTAGKNKDRLDPFKKLSPGDADKIKSVLDEVHKNFISFVVKGRGNKLHGSPETLFSGDFWTGSQAVKLGLADETANLWTAMQENFKTSYYRKYTPHRPFWETVVQDMSAVLHIGLVTKDKNLQAVL